MISVVVPALDEEEGIGACVAAVAGGPGVEVLVVDGGSSDATRARAEAAGARVLGGIRGRAAQMNLGAAQARGEILLFLHVDTRLPPGGLEAIRAALADPGVAGGGFRKRYHPETPILAASAWLQNRIRSGLLGLLVGTNAIFVRRAVFEAVGGYPVVPLLEDVLFSDRLRAAGRVAVLPGPVEVSSRRYLGRGVAAQMLLNLEIMFRFRCLGESPESLARRYRRKEG